MCHPVQHKRPIALESAVETSNSRHTTRKPKNHWLYQHFPKAHQHSQLGPPYHQASDSHLTHDQLAQIRVLQAGSGALLQPIFQHSALAFFRVYQTRRFQLDHIA